MRAPFWLPAEQLRRRLDRRTDAYQNEQQLNYLPDGVWLKSLICSSNFRLYDHVAAFRFFLSIHTLRLTQRNLKPTDLPYESPKQTAL